MEPVFLHQILFIVVSTFQVHATGNAWSWRTWQTNINYSDSHNWNIGRVPCDTDKVILQMSDSIALELPGGKVSLQGLVLSSDTVVMLPKDGVIQFTETIHSPTCDGKDAVFKHTSTSSWIDPINWNGWNLATPDLERIPCTYEAVRFPQGATYSVLMPYDEIRLETFEINGISMDNMDWLTFANKDEGFRQFFKANGDIADVFVGGLPCQVSQWCECGNDYLHLQVCTADCPLPLCRQPVHPSGFCCPICGVYLLLEGTLQNRPLLEQHVDSFLRDKGVVWHASKVKELIQIVLVEKGEYSGSVLDTARDLNNFLVKSNTKWAAVEFHTSGHAWYPTSFGQVIGNLLMWLVFAVLTLTTIVVYYSHDWRAWLRFPAIEGRPFMFARFENQTGEVVMASDQGHSMPVLPQAFDNPMYGATGQLGQEQRSFTVKNPVFVELEEDTKDAEPSEEGITLDSPMFSEKEY